METTFWRGKRALSFIILSILLINTPLLSQEKSASKPIKEKKEVFLSKEKAKNTTPFSMESSATSTFIQSFIILVLFLLLLYFAIKWLQKKKWLKQAPQDDQIITLLKKTALSGNQSIQLVEIGQKVYILGLADQSISLISTIENQDEIKEIKDLCLQENTDKEMKSFKEILQSYFKPKEKLSEPLAQEDPLKLFKEQRNKLKQLRNKF